MSSGLFEATGLLKSKEGFAVRVLDGLPGAVADVSLDGDVLFSKKVVEFGERALKAFLQLRQLRPGFSIDEAVSAPLLVARPTLLRLRHPGSVLVLSACNRGIDPRLLVGDRGKEGAELLALLTGRLL